MRPDDLRAGTRPDRLQLLARLAAEVAESRGQDRGDVLRSAAAACAYNAAARYGDELRRIEATLVTAATGEIGVSPLVADTALDIVRTHMVRGLMRAQLEAGEHMTFWVRR